MTIACPRGWSGINDTPSNGFLATMSHSVYAVPTDADVYIRDRIARARSFEIVQTAGLTLGQVAATDETSANVRLFAESVNFFDATTDPATDYGAFVGLPAGQVGRFGALVRTESLVMRPEDLIAAYDAAPPYLVPGGPLPQDAEYPAAFVQAVPSLAGYVYHQASPASSEGYFAVSTCKRYDFHSALGSGRGLVLSQRDPLMHESQIDYDTFGLLPIVVRDPADLATSAIYSRRTLLPSEVTDCNGNVTRIAYSPSGLATDTWVLGKPDAPGSDRQNAGDRTLPSIHVEYDWLAFQRSRAATPDSPQPAASRTVRRVFHDSDPDDTGETVEVREYSDGFGRVLQTRAQSDDVIFGDETFGGGAAVLSVDPANGPGDIVEGNRRSGSSTDAVVVSGWQRYDNKGQVIEKFEPFWSAGWDYEAPRDAELGQKATFCYDPRGQVIRAVNPDGSEQRVIHGVPNNLDDPPLDPDDAGRFAPTPWEACTYDANDNAGRTPAADPNASNYRHHWNTPASIEVDALGRTVRAVARNREAAASATAALPPIDEYVTRSTYDIQGNVTEFRDQLGRLAFRTVYDLTGRALRRESIDSGSHRDIFDALGSPVEARDGRSAIRLRAYDLLNRPVCLWARDAPEDAVTLRERIVYGDGADAPGATADKQAGNLLGKPWRSWDEAGVVTSPAYDFMGRAISTSRQVLSDDFVLSDFRSQSGPAWTLRAPRVDWNASSQPGLDPYAYQCQTSFDALSRVKVSNYPVCANGDRYRMKPTFSRAGRLERIELLGPLDANGEGASQVFVERIAYNAKGQRVLISYGNGLMTRYAYDAKTFRLMRTRTESFVSTGTATYKRNGQPLQDLVYTYDLMGNAVSILDRTPGSGVVNNPTAARADPALQTLLAAGDALLREFAYDPLYRLVGATGRECADIPTPRPSSDDPRCGYNSGRHGTPNQDNAPNLCAFYREQYDYDPSGNMTRLRHGGAGPPSWVRTFGMSGFKPAEWQQKLTDWKQRTVVDWGQDGNRLTNVGDGDDEAGVNHSVRRQRQHARRTDRAPLRVGSRQSAEGIPQSGRHQQADCLCGLPL